MTVAPGTPTFTPPAYSAPVLAAGSVAIGAVIAPVKLESTSGTAQTNIPFRFGQVFKMGDLAPGAFIVGKIAGQADIPLQFNVLATFPDGSVRHAAISGVLPSLAAGAVVSMDLVRSSAGASTAPLAASALSALAASVVLDFAGVAYTANPGPALAALAAGAARTPGAIATEYNVTIAPATSAGAAHPDLEVKFDVVHFPGANAFKIDVTFEHTKAFSPTGDLSYGGTIQIGGATAYTLPAPLTQFPHTRWKKTFWQNSPAPLVVRQDRDYWIDSRAVANYDRRITIAESALAGYVGKLAGIDFTPMHSGMFTPYMGEVGGRPDIGLLPGYAAATVLSMDKRAIAITKGCGDIGGSWGTHWRDVSSGPGKGYPLSAVNWPFVTEIYSAADTNPATGQKEFMNSPASATWLTPEESHTPNLAYLPYLLTADLFYLEEMQFWTTWVVNKQNYSYRQGAKGIIQRNQTRGQAWCMRGIAECAAFTPDNHPLKSHFQYWLDSNLANYDARYTNKPGPALGCLNDPDMDTEYAFAGTKCGIGVYQDDFFTSVIGHIVELGFVSAKPLLLWKAKFQISRMLGTCYINSCFITVRIRDSQYSAEYATIADCMVGTIGSNLDGFGTYSAEIHNAPCNSQARLDLMNAGRPANEAVFQRGEIIGYSRGTEGYVADLQPGLAMAADSGYPDGDLAWDLYDNRTVKPAYENSPQFAIVPRGAATTPAPVTPTPTPEGIRSMKLIDTQKQVATVSSAAVVNLGAAVGTFRTLAQAIASGASDPAQVKVGDTGVPFYLRNPLTGDTECSLFTITSATQITRESVSRSTNNNQPVAFGGAAVEVYSAAPSDYLAGVPVPAYIAANPGGAITSSDILLTVQGNKLVGESASDLAKFAMSTYPTAKTAVVKVTTAITFPLDFSTHNRRRIVCTAAATITGPSSYASVGDDFECKIANLSGADIALSGITVYPSGSVIPNGAVADVFSTGGSIYAALYGTASAATGATVTAPGQVTGLAAGTATSTTQPLTWSAPTGTAPFTYKVEYSTDGTTWATASANVSGAAYTVTGLTASTSYKYRVTATNSANTGTPSAIVTASTAAIPTVVPGQVTGLTAGTPTATTVPLTWTAPASGGAPSAYTVNYRASGATAWTAATTTATATNYTVTGLSAATAYEFQAIATNSAGPGTASSTASATTAAAAAAEVSPFDAYALGNNTHPLNSVFTFPDSNMFCSSQVVKKAGSTSTATVTDVQFFLSLASSNAHPADNIAPPAGRKYAMSINQGTNLTFEFPGLGAQPASKDYWFWIRATDSNAQVWWFRRPNPITIGDNVPNPTTRLTVNELMVEA